MATTLKVGDRVAVRMYGTTVSGTVTARHRRMTLGETRQVFYDLTVATPMADRVRQIKDYHHSFVTREA